MSDGYTDDSMIRPAIPNAVEVWDTLPSDTVAGIAGTILWLKRSTGPQLKLQYETREQAEMALSGLRRLGVNIEGDQLQ